jgi:preprotein translocase subunit YajC
MTFSELLAQATKPGTVTGTPTGAPGPEGNPTTMIIWFVLIGVIFWFLLLRPKQKEQKQRAQMLSGIKKYDKVMTIGGVIGTVMEVRDEEIIVKVDDSTNTRIKFTRGAIQRILSSAESEKEKSE